MVQKSEFQSVVPGFPVLTEDSISDYRIYWGATVLFFLLFGGLFAPMAEVKFGVGGTSYADFVSTSHPFPETVGGSRSDRGLVYGRCSWCHFGFFRD